MEKESILSPTRGSLGTVTFPVLHSPFYSAAARASIHAEAGVGLSHLWGFVTPQYDAREGKETRELGGKLANRFHRHSARIVCFRHRG